LYKESLMNIVLTDENCLQCRCHNQRAPRSLADSTWIRITLLSMMRITKWTTLTINSWPHPKLTNLVDHLHN
jgi:hypothetical protein